MSASDVFRHSEAVDSSGQRASFGEEEDATVRAGDSGRLYYWRVDRVQGMGSDGDNHVLLLYELGNSVAGLRSGLANTPIFNVAADPSWR
jgi:hypothetical protein